MNRVRRTTSGSIRSFRSCGESTPPTARNALRGAVFSAGRLVGPYELALHREDGEDLEVELVVSTSKMKVSTHLFERRQESRTVYVYTFRDIAERKKAEAAQRHAVEEALSASRAKSEFLANMSHELRTPLNAIIGFSEILKNEMFGPHVVSQYKEYSSDIYQSGAYLLDVINDILDVSKIESDQFNLHEQPSSLLPILDASIKIVGRREEARELSIEKAVALDFPMLMVDARVLRQILINLLSNAVKFTEPGGIVTVEATLDEDGAAVLRVIDTGVGIPEEAPPIWRSRFTRRTGPWIASTRAPGLACTLFISSLPCWMARSTFRTRSAPARP